MTHDAADDVGVEPSSRRAGVIHQHAELVAGHVVSATGEQIAAGITDCRNSFSMVRENSSSWPPLYAMSRCDYRYAPPIRRHIRIRPRASAARRARDS
jgi:hypothetical protein